MCTEDALAWSNSHDASINLTCFIYVEVAWIKKENNHQAAQRTQNIYILELQPDTTNRTYTLWLRLPMAQLDSL